jgi:hypothetical protein
MKSQPGFELHQMPSRHIQKMLEERRRSTPFEYTEKRIITSQLGDFTAAEDFLNSFTLSALESRGCK